MADELDKKTNRYTGTIKYLDSQGTGYIVPTNMEIFVTPSSLPSKTPIQGDRVEFSIKFRDSNPQIEAIDVTPIRIKCFKCRKSGHSTKECSKGFPIPRVRCYRCKKIGHLARDCDQKIASFGSYNGGSGGKGLVGFSSNSNSNSVVSVKKWVEVKKVEEVEDCFILEFDPSENTEGKSENERKEKEEDCEVMRSIVCVKNVEDVKKVEEVEDCFILEFDPDDPHKFTNLSICDNSEDVSILAEKGQVACRDYPHSRHLCAAHPFNTTLHEKHCKMCYCFVCEKPAPCTRWTIGSPLFRHCNAADLSHWRDLRNLERFGRSRSVGKYKNLKYESAITTCAIQPCLLKSVKGYMNPRWIHWSTHEISVLEDKHRDHKIPRGRMRGR